MLSGPSFKPLRILLWSECFTFKSTSIFHCDSVKADSKLAVDSAFLNNAVNRVDNIMKRGGKMYHNHSATNSKKFSKSLILCCAAALGLNSAVELKAETAFKDGSPNNASSASMLTLPANTEVVLRLTDDLTSKGNQHKVGHVFRLVVAYDVKVQGKTVIPSGTMATGEVTKRSGKGVFGKAGRLEVEMRNIDLNGQRIPVVGSYRQKGESNTTAAVGAVVLAAGLLFVTGKSAVIPRGREFTAYTISAQSLPAI